jgi:HEAT repeat protein
VRAEIGEEDIPPLVRLMGHDRPAVRMAAGHLLLSMGEPALEALREAAGSADWHTRYVAQDALMTLEIRQHSDD